MEVLAAMRSWPMKSSRPRAARTDGKAAGRSNRNGGSYEKVMRYTFPLGEVKYSVGVDRTVSGARSAQSGLTTIQGQGQGGQGRQRRRKWAALESVVTSTAAHAN